MNPKPLPRPVLLSLTIRTESISPQSLNTCLSGSSSVSKLIHIINKQLESTHIIIMNFKQVSWKERQKSVRVSIHDISNF